MSNLQIWNFNSAWLGYFTAHIRDRFFNPQLAGKPDSENTYCAIGDHPSMCAFGMIRGWDEGWDEKVIGIWVSPDYRGKGFGDMMMDWLEFVARQRGLKSLRLHVSDANDIAFNLYVKHGWTTDGKRDNGEWIMRKRLL